jgi:hypothetical protein
MHKRIDHFGLVVMNAGPEHDGRLVWFEFVIGLECGKRWVSEDIAEAV